jgi:hypothetical protein
LGLTARREKAEVVLKEANKSVSYSGFHRASAAYQSVFEGIPFEQRITHIGSHGFPDATFDYLFGKNVKFGTPIITQTNVSDHLPLTCDVAIQ